MTTTKLLRNTQDIQQVLLDDFMLVRKIWDKHQYYYCLTGGSVLGAVRHKGFIPWDDDFDVGLSRKDYEDFVFVTSNELPHYLKLYQRKKTQQYVIFDTRYEIEYSQEDLDALFDGENAIAHPTLDLQIFDGTPNGKLRRLLFLLRVMSLRARIKIAEPEKIHQATWRPAWENILIRLLTHLPKKSPRKVERLVRKYTATIRKYTFDQSEYIADFIGKYHFKDVYPKSWWLPAIEVEFEGEKVPIPNGYDNYLTQIYGDYMIVPEIENQVRHIVEA